MGRLWDSAPKVAQGMETVGEFVTKMRYLYNGLRIWFAPKDDFQGGRNRILADHPVSKDKWVTADMMVFSHPTLRDDQVKDSAEVLFGPGSDVQERYDDPEVQGSKIALIVAKQQQAQKPPSSLDHMKSIFLKQYAYNQRVLSAENEISGINCDIADFLSGMSNDPAEQLVVCINASEEMKRNEAAVGGQLWIQGERQMTAMNKVAEGLANDKESAILSATVEAATWKSALDLDDGPRKGQRVVIYPKEMTQLEQVLSTGDPSLDDVNGHPTACANILQASQKYEHPPVFLKEDDEQITSNEKLAAKVPMWMNIAAQVATGSRRMVHEDGPDVMNSDNDDAI
jgi:hypothetical protein